MKILTEPQADRAKHTIRAIALIAHPDHQSDTVDITVINTGYPIFRRICDLITSALGDEWAILDWYTTGDEF